MASTTFVDFSQPAVNAAWLNDVNNVTYNILGSGGVAPTSAPVLRANIGLGSMAIQNANAVAITGGSIVLTTALPIASGGTGATTLGAAQLALAGPTFSCNKTTPQTIVTSTFTEMSGYAAVDWDTTSAFNTSTGRYTPLVAGYYEVFCQGSLSVASGTMSNAQLMLYKNGVLWRNITADLSYPSSILNRAGSFLVFLNGSTDYISLWAYIAGTTPTIVGSLQAVYLHP